MPNSIKIYNLENNASWEKQLSDAECTEVQGYIKGGKGTVGIIPATFKPVRTNNLNNFAKDFFLPTTVNHAIKVQNTIGKIFAILAALVFDMITFPVRLVTCIPRVNENAGTELSLFRNYLLSEGVDAKLLESDHVKVRLDWEIPTTMIINRDGRRHIKNTIDKHWRVTNINFIEVPAYEGSCDFSEGVRG